MTDKLLILENKVRESKNGNALVSGLQKYAKAGGSAAIIENIILTTSARIQSGHAVYLLFIHGYTNKHFNAVADKLIDCIKQENNFREMISLASIVSEFKSKIEGVKISEEAFSDIEGSGDYLFHAVNGALDVSSNSSIESIDGNGFASISVGERDYKISTVNSVYEDIRSSRESMDTDDYISSLVSLSKCFYFIGDIDKGNALYAEAISSFKRGDNFFPLFAEVGDCEAPGISVYNPRVILKFPDENIRKDLKDLAKVTLIGDDLETAMSLLDE